jgi:hypothetical protein
MRGHHTASQSRADLEHLASITLSSRRPQKSSVLTHSRGSGEAAAEPAPSIRDSSPTYLKKVQQLYRVGSQRCSAELRRRVGVSARMHAGVAAGVAWGWKKCFQAHRRVQPARRISTHFKPELPQRIPSCVKRESQRASETRCTYNGRCYGELQIHVTLQTS